VKRNVKDVVSQAITAENERLFATKIEDLRSAINMYVMEPDQELRRANMNSMQHDCIHLRDMLTDVGVLAQKVDVGQGTRLLFFVKFACNGFLYLVLALVKV
jgi:hypothetical protein